MAANRLRQAATRLASVAASSGMATSRPARVVGKTVGVGAAGAATYSAAEYALSETVPYGADGGRRRGPEPLWATVVGAVQLRRPLLLHLGPATVDMLDEIGLSELARKLSPDALAPVPAGRVCMHWIQPDSTGPRYLAEVCSPAYQQAVEASVQAVLAVLQEEAKEKGFGKHVLEHGFHVIVAPVDACSAAALPNNTVLLPAGLLLDCLAFTRKPNKQLDHPAAMAALQFVLAHEMAHLYLQHGREAARRTTARAGIQLVWRAGLWARSVPVVGDALELWTPLQPSKTALLWASGMKTHYWEREFEADEVACALMARLRLPGDHWAAGMHMLARSVMWHGQLTLSVLQQWQQQLSPEEKRERAAEYGFPGADFEAGVELLQAALATGEVDTFQQLDQRFQAVAKWHKQWTALSQPSSEGGSTEDGMGVSGSVDGGERSGGATRDDLVDEWGRTLMADSASTHPGFAPRLARINHLSCQLPMLLRATAPPVAVGGRYSHISVAEQVAQRLADGLAKESAARAAEAAAQEAAAKAAEATVQAAAARAAEAAAHVAAAKAAEAAAQAAAAKAAAQRTTLAS